MLKPVLNHEHSALEALARTKLHELLKPVSFVSLGAQHTEPALAAGSWRPDFSIDLQAEADAWLLICQVKADGQQHPLAGRRAEPEEEHDGRAGLRDEVLRHALLHHAAARGGEGPAAWRWVQPAGGFRVNAPAAPC